MNTSAPPLLRRSMSLAVAGILVAVLTACTGRGGGTLPPVDPPGDLDFTGQASFGFTFSCEDKGGLNPPTGQLRIQVSYTDHGSNPIGSRFSIHGIVDTIDPVLESLVCSGLIPPPEPLPPNELIFLGRYRLTTSAPAGFPTTCPTRETPTTPLCRFEIEVHDNDQDHAPSQGDFFSIKLSTIKNTTVTIFPEFPDPAVPYARAGFLEGGNLTVD